MTYDIAPWIEKKKNSTMELHSKKKNYVLHIASSAQGGPGRPGPRTGPRPGPRTGPRPAAGNRSIIIVFNCSAVAMLFTMVRR